MDLDNKLQDEYRREHITYIPPDITKLSVNDYTIQSGINFKDFDRMKVHCSGNNVPSPLSSFKDADLNTELISGLKYINCENPTPIQKYAIPCINCGRDIIACSQTGSGKTVAYLLPIINILLKSKKSCTDGKYSSPRALILAPTRELALQISAVASFLSKDTCINIGSVYGGTNVAHQVNKIKNSDIIVATPGRLLHLLSENRIKLSLIKFVVFDEADHILDLDLWSEVEEIMDRYNNAKCEEVGQMLMFSATFPEQLQQLASNFLKNYVFLSVGVVGIACKDVEQMFYQIKDTGKNEKLVKLMGLLNNQGKNNPPQLISLTHGYIDKSTVAEHIILYEHKLTFDIKKDLTELKFINNVKLLDHAELYYINKHKDLIFNNNVNTNNPLLKLKFQ